MLPYKWEMLTSPEFDEAIEKSKGLCILPIGCLERHSEHIAVGCDSVIAENAADMAAEMEYAVVFPTGMWLGDLFCTHTFKGDELTKNKTRGQIAISPRLLFDVLSELCEEIHRNGFRKILILTGHGGNVPFLEYFIRAVLYEKKDYAVMWANVCHNDYTYPSAVLKAVKERPNDFPKLTDEEMAVLEKFAITGPGGGHADIQEVALCMSKYPEMIRPEFYESVDGLTTHKGDYLIDNGIHHGNWWFANFPNFYDGFPPIGCTENIGKATAILTAERIANIYKIIKDDEYCVQLAKSEV